VPTLIFSGAYDPSTPASLGAEVARHLGRSRHVIVRNESHGSEFGKMMASLGATAIQFGDALLPALSAMGNWVAGMVKLSPGMVKWATSIGVVTAALGPFLYSSGKIVSWFTQIWLWLPKMAKGVYSLGAAFKGLWAAISPVLVPLAVLVGTFTALWIGLSKLGDVANQVQDPMKRFGPILGALIRSFQWLGDKMSFASRKWKEWLGLQEDSAEKTRRAAREAVAKAKEQQAAQRELEKQLKSLAKTSAETAEGMAGDAEKIAKAWDSLREVNSDAAFEKSLEGMSEPMAKATREWNEFRKTVEATYKDLEEGPEREMLEAQGKRDIERKGIELMALARAEEREETNAQIAAAAALANAREDALGALEREAKLTRDVYTAKTALKKQILMLDAEKDEALRGAENAEERLRIEKAFLARRKTITEEAGRDRAEMEKVILAELIESQIRMDTASAEAIVSRERDKYDALFREAEKHGADVTALRAQVDLEMAELEENLKADRGSDFFAGFNLGMKEVRKNILTIGQMGAQMAHSLAGGFANAFTAVVTGSKSASEAFREFAMQFLKQMVAMIAQALVLAFLTSIFSFGSSTATGTAAFVKSFGALAALGGAQHAQAGGTFKVGGIGSVDSQLVPMALSPGELVQVTPANGGAMGGISITLENNGPPMDVAGVERSEMDGGQHLMIRLEEKLSESVKRGGVLGRTIRDIHGLGRGGKRRG